MSQGETVLKTTRDREARYRAREGAAGNVIALLREQTEAAASESKTQLAAQVAGLARAVRRGSDQLHEDELLRLARLSDVLADELEAAGDYLETQNARELLEDLRHLFQQRSSLILGSTVVVGMLTFYLAPKLRQRRYREERHAF